MSEKNDKSVLGSLPSTRPARMGRRRDGAAATPKAAPAKPRATAAKPKPKPAPAAKPKPAAKPRAVRSGSPSLERPAAERAPRREPARPPKGTELVTTAVQAAGELTTIGVKLGGRMVKRAVDRLPKP